MHNTISFLQTHYVIIFVHSIIIVCTQQVRNQLQSYETNPLTNPRMLPQFPQQVRVCVVP